MTPEEIMSVFERVCPDCDGEITTWQVEGHPDHLEVAWSCDGNILIARDNMPRDYMFKFDDSSWIGNILTIVTAMCESGHEHYMERSAVSGDWH
jgi:hypothetical protein